MNKLITLEEIKERLEEIRSLAYDDETAHSRQDSLYLDVLTAIASGAKNARQLAAEAIKADDIEFSRWYA